MASDAFPAHSASRWGLEAVAVFVCLALCTGLSLTAASRKSVTFDETSHLAIGYTRFVTGDYHFHPENGLPQHWAAIGLLANSWNFPPIDEQPWIELGSFDIGQNFLFASNNDADAILNRARMMMSIQVFVLGLVVYCWSRRLFGVPGGFISLALFATDPTMLAHGPLVTADVAAALFLCASLGALWSVMHRVTAWTLLVSGLAMSGLFLAKMSAITLIPTGLLMAAVQVVVGRPLELAWRGRVITLRHRGTQALLLGGLVMAHAAIVWAAVWAFFGFRFQATLDNYPNRGYEYRANWPVVFDKPGITTDAVSFAYEHHLLPEPFLFSFASMTFTSGDRTAFLDGERYLGGKVSFFPRCLVYKTPPALIVLLGVAAFAMARRNGSGACGIWDRQYDLTPLLAFQAVYWGFAVTNPMNIGHRHLIPVYPSMFILAGGAALWLRCTVQTARSRMSYSWKSRPSILVIALLCFSAAEALWIWPHYLAYFNFIAGGPSNGYKHLVDSSLDWGQDLKGLAGWLDEHGLKTSPLYLSYFGTGVPEYYGINAINLPSFFALGLPERITPFRGGTYCISATMLQGLYFDVGPFRDDWGDRQEKLYRGAMMAMNAFDTIRDDPQLRKDVFATFQVENMEQLRWLIEEARLARLSTYLRGRKPDAQIGHSIFVYRLTDADVQHALYGPIR